LAAVHISSVNCAEMAENRPRQHTYKIFSVKHRLQQFDPVGSKNPAYGGLKFEYPLQNA